MIRRAVLGLALLLFVTSLSLRAEAAVAFVQSKAVGCSSLSTCAATPTANPATGNLLAVGVFWSDATQTLSSVTDGTNTYTLLNNPTSCGGTRMAMAYAKNITGGALTITATFGGTATTPIVVVHEVSGADTTAPLDGNTAQCQQTPGTGTDAVTSGSITTGSNGDYIFGATSDSGTGTPTATQGTGFTLREQAVAFHGFASEDQIQSSAGAITGTFTLNYAGATDQTTGVMAFKPAGGVGGGGSAPCIIGGGVIQAGCPG